MTALNRKEREKWTQHTRKKYVFALPKANRIPMYTAKCELYMLDLINESLHVIVQVSEASDETPLSIIQSQISSLCTILKMSQSVVAVHLSLRTEIAIESP